MTPVTTATAHHATGTAKTLPAYRRLHEVMRQQFTVRSLTGIEPEAFLERLLSFMDERDETRFADPARQNPMSVRFHWGHRHDFGTFCLEGRMGNHHVAVIAAFTDVLRALPPRLEGRQILDVGCWTGGTSLLLAALGATVTAIEEVPMYVEASKFLAESFGVAGRARYLAVSLYECTGPEHQDRYDHVLLSGVLHHLSDPRLALRICFNSLRDGGTCLIETLGYEKERAGLDRDDASAAPAYGWNLLLFAPRRLEAMLRSVGFEIDHPCAVIEGRTHVVARRDRHADMFRCGLSARGVR